MTKNQAIKAEQERIKLLRAELAAAKQRLAELKKMRSMAVQEQIDGVPFAIGDTVTNFSGKRLEITSIETSDKYGWVAYGKINGRGRVPMSKANWMAAQCTADDVCWTDLFVAFQICKGTYRDWESKHPDKMSFAIGALWARALGYVNSDNGDVSPGENFEEFRARAAKAID